MYVCMCVCVYHTSQCMRVCMCVNVCVSQLKVCMRVYMCVFVCISLAGQHWLTKKLELGYSLLIRTKRWCNMTLLVTAANNLAKPMSHILHTPLEPTHRCGEWFSLFSFPPLVHTCDTHTHTHTHTHKHTHTQTHTHTNTQTHTHKRV